jgi:hypothetical protein
MHAIRGCCTSGPARRFGGSSLHEFAGGFLNRFAVLLPAVLLCGAGLRSAAQTVRPADDVSVATVSSSNEVAEVQPAFFITGTAGAELPEAPEPQNADQNTNQKPDPRVQEQKPLVAATPATAAQTANMPMAPMYSRVIPAGMATPQIHKWDKIILASRNLYSATSFASIIFSAGWSHVMNGQPNYGTDSGAFGERLGAAGIRDSTQAFLSNGPFAVWFHQDPRYFAMGRGHSLMKRTWYSITRPLITRDSTDGHAEFNTSLVLGQAAGTALNNLYYPQSNRNFHDNLASFGGSMGGSALSFALDEFTSDLLRIVRLRQLERRLGH